MTITYSLAEAADRIGGCTERWLADQIRAGRFPAHKIGQSWRMTEQDIERAVEACLQPATTRPAGITELSARRRGRAS